MILHEFWKKVSKGWSRQANDIFVIKHLFAYQCSHCTHFYTWQKSVLRIFEGIYFWIQVSFLAQAVFSLKTIIDQKNFASQFLSWIDIFRNIPISWQRFALMVFVSCLQSSVTGSLFLIWKKITALLGMDFWLLSMPP